MDNATNDQPYQDFLSKHSELSSAADAVFERIADYTHIDSVAALREAAEKLREKPAAKPKKRFNLTALLEAELRPSIVDKVTISRAALICRAIEIVLQISVRHYQVAAALLLRKGIILEMPNGSGKTLVAAISASINALAGLHTHIVTANDYLAERDLRWMGPVYTALGLRCSVLFSAQNQDYERGELSMDGETLQVSPRFPTRVNPAPNNDVEAEETDDAESESTPSSEPPMNETPDDAADTPPPVTDSGELGHVTNETYEVNDALTAKTVLSCELVYGRMNSFAFAFLKDQRVSSPEQQALVARDVLLIDECDTVLLDSFSSPLSLTENTRANILGFDFQVVTFLFTLSTKLVRDIDFIVERNDAYLTGAGIETIEQLTGKDIYTEEFSGLAHGLVQILKAKEIYKRDEDYVVQNGKVVIVDKRSGRLEPDTVYSNGLHAIIELKEGLYPSTMYSSRSIVETKTKDFVLTYRLVSGMSGVVGPEEEYLRYYQLATTKLTPYASIRIDLPDLVYLTPEEARRSLVELAVEKANQGRAVLVNVPAISDVDSLAPAIIGRAPQVQILDGRAASSLGEEAAIIARAGSAGSITLCSRVAARGTDIKLSEEARANGGLLVIGLERSRDRRYDDQLRGRAARYTDPGESLFVISLKDDLMQLFYSDRVTKLMLNLGMEENDAIEHSWVTNAIRNAQKKVRIHDQLRRAKALALDDVIARHRLVYFHIRQKLLEKDDLEAEIYAMLKNWVRYKQQTVLRTLPAEADAQAIAQLFGNFRQCLDHVEIQRVMQVRNRKRRSIMLEKTLEKKLELKLQELKTLAGPAHTRSFIKEQILSRIDANWTAHMHSEKRTREETFLLQERDSAITRYMEEMESTFDRFFYQTGEEILSMVLNVTVKQPLHLAS